MARGKRILAFAAAATLGVGSLSAMVSQAAAWEPQKPVEFIIMAGPGGGADQIARLLQGLIEQKNLSPVPFIPINKEGGSGAEALRYLQDKAGDDYTLLVTLNSFYTTPIIQKNLGVDVTKFTPIGRMALDTFLLWVNTDKKDINSLDDYVAAVKAKGKDWKVGGTGSGQEDSILTAMMESEFGYKVTYIPYPGRRHGGEGAGWRPYRFHRQQSRRAERVHARRQHKAAGAVHRRAHGGLSGRSDRQGARSRRRLLHAALDQRTSRHGSRGGGLVHRPLPQALRCPTSGRSSAPTKASTARNGWQATISRHSI